MAVDSEQGKLFVGGIPWETTEDRLKDYFQTYGEVREVVIMKDRATGRSRGFGFVLFADPEVADRVVEEKHTIDGRQVPKARSLYRNVQNFMFVHLTVTLDLVRSDSSYTSLDPSQQLTPFVFLFAG